MCKWCFARLIWCIFLLLITSLVMFILFKSCHHPWFSSPMGGLFVFYNSVEILCLIPKFVFCGWTFPFDSDFLETFSELYCIHLLVWVKNAGQAFQIAWLFLRYVDWQKHPSHYVFCWYLVCRMFCPFSFTVQLLAACYFELNVLKWLQSGGLGVL